MKRRSATATPSSWIEDYSAARADAIRRLGDRCLLAKPSNGSRSSKEPAPAATTDH